MDHVLDFCLGDSINVGSVRFHGVKEIALNLGSIFRAYNMKLCFMILYGRKISESIPGC